MPSNCAWCSKPCALLDDHAARRDAHLARRGSDRHAQGLRWARRASPGGALREPVHGPRVRVPRPCGRSGEGAVVGWYGPVPLRQAARARPLRMAAGTEWRGVAECRAAVDAARGHRLAPARENVGAAARVLIQHGCVSVKKSRAITQKLFTRAGALDRLALCSTPAIFRTTSKRSSA